MRYLGIDFGVKRIGLAVSDGEGSLAFPYSTLVRTTRKKMFQELLQILEQEKVEAIVLGLPYDIEGRETESTRQALNFRNSLQRRTDCPVFTLNEVLSTAEAAELYRETGKKVPYGDHLDHLAAAVILQRFLDLPPDAD